MRLHEAKHEAVLTPRGTESNKINFTLSFTVSYGLLPNSPVLMETALSVCSTQQNLEGPHAVSQLSHEVINI